VFLVGFIVIIYDDARSYERRTQGGMVVLYMSISEDAFFVNVMTRKLFSKPGNGERCHLLGSVSSDHLKD